MTESELALYNIGENLDSIMNLDPRGYGVCRILYPAARKLAKGPVSTCMADKLCNVVLTGSTVYILTGFILRPHLHPETDGIVGAILLCRALILAFEAKPVIICPIDNLSAIRNCAPLIGMHLYNSIGECRNLPLSFAALVCPKDKAEAAAFALKLTNDYPLPSAVFATEAPGANSQGEYHNAVGVNTTDIEAKMDDIFASFQSEDVPCFAVGDLGNEIGMGAIAEQIRKFIPYTSPLEGKTGCACGCREGILAKTSADYLLTATVSDWGVYAIIAAIAFLKKDIGIMHDGRTVEAVLRECSRSGMVDMTGSLLPAIDGFDVSLIQEISTLMRNTVAYALEYKNKSWFSETLSRGFYDRL